MAKNDAKMQSSVHGFGDPAVHSDQAFSFRAVHPVPAFQDQAVHSVLDFWDPAVLSFPAFADPAIFDAQWSAAVLNHYKRISAKMMSK